MNDLIKSKHPRDIFNELKWKEDTSINECSIEYIHRGVPGNTKTVSGENIVDIGHSFLTLYPDTMIPYHRILKIKYRGKNIYVKTATGHV
ncbi:RNA repair domain-containing protein [Methanolobus mangrovi]|uniref:RNA repair domain-containing protein n=1 Tax=Methanolobus mangrovi TaxID=3072977 RepID=A0AA51UHF2_9EURY|nr:RNA repair domain-containing protein [Methanolobus mangrovi]WMW23200.1 RNA repair domain-containing protein [Methanolobus mangrovi]